MAARESTSLMLVLSAIDLLLASLVAGVVLFICLAGATAGSSGPAPEEHHFPMLVTLITPATDPVDAGTTPGNAGSTSIPRIQGLRPDVALRSQAAVPPSWWNHREEAKTWLEQSWMLDGTQEELRFESMPATAYVRIDLGAAGSVDIFATCSEQDFRFAWSIALQRFTENTCPSGRTILFDPNVTLLPRRALLTTMRPDAMVTHTNWQRIGELGEHTVMAATPAKDPGAPLHAKGADLMAFIWE